jgi:hypothetical protein
MCVIVLLNDDEIETVADLARLVGKDRIVWHDDLAAVDWNSCLCQIDVETTAAVAGYDCAPDPFGYVWTSRDPRAPSASAGGARAH